MNSEERSETDENTEDIPFRGPKTVEKPRRFVYNLSSAGDRDIIREVRL